MTPVIPYGYPNFQSVDDATISEWVVDCLKTQDDGSIARAMSGMLKVDTGRVADAILGQFNDQVDVVGRRKFRVRMISIPVSVTCTGELDESVFVIQNIKHYLQLFYQYGLIDKSNGGVVLMNQLIDHAALENAPLSDLYALRQSIFDGAKSNAKQQLNFANIGKDAVEWLPIPDGAYTMRHLVGVVFWDAAKSPPPIISGNGDVDGWQNAVAQAMAVDVCQRGVGVEISILPPNSFFESMLAATSTMIDKIVTSLVIEAKSYIGDAVAKVSVGCDTEIPGKNQIRVAMSPEKSPEHVMASVTICLSIMESLHTGTVLKFICNSITGYGIKLLGNEYFTGPIQESVTRTGGHLH